jgi:hypothetical protein
MEVELAEMVPGGWALWRQFVDAAAAWSGQPADQQPDGQMLLSEAGETLGFARLIARRLNQPTLTFGPARYRTRLA